MNSLAFEFILRLFHRKSELMDLECPDIEDEEECVPLETK